MRNFSSKTKKSFLQESGKREIVKLALAVVLVCVVLYFSHGLIGALGSSVVGMTYRVREYFTHSTAVFPSYLRERGTLVDTIHELKEELASHSGDTATIARLSHENDELRSLLGDTADSRILAGVLARPPMVPYDVLVADRGSMHGVREGAVVYHKNNHAIGMVTRVYERNSLVTLFSSSGVESTVYLYGPDVFAHAYGEGGGVIRVSLPQGILVREGDPVVLPSLHMGDLGIVGRVVSLPTQPEQSAYVTFPVSLQSMRTILISSEPMVPVSYADLTTNVERLTEMFNVAVPTLEAEGEDVSTSSQRVITP